MHYIIVQKGSVHYTDYIVQSSAANNLRFIIIFFLKPMEPALLFWWAKANSLLEKQRDSKASVSQGPRSLPEQSDSLAADRVPWRWPGWCAHLSSSDLYFQQCPWTCPLWKADQTQTTVVPP